jgi:hypothetical protein
MSYDNIENMKDDVNDSEIENYNQESVENDDSQEINMTQVPPGRRRNPNAPNQPNPTRPPGFPEFSDLPNPSEIPAQAPMSAPPYIIPQLPPGLMMPAPGTNEFNLQYENPERHNNMQWQLRRCINRFTFIWFWNGRGFWFYPTFVGRRAMEGFIWRQGRWNYERINLNRILYFRCF